MHFFIIRVKDQTSTILESTVIQKENPSLGSFSSSSTGDNCMSLSINIFPKIFTSNVPFPFSPKLFDPYFPEILTT